MQGPVVSKEHDSFDQFEFLEREAKIAASLGDLNGVTAKLGSYCARKHYVSVSVHEIGIPVATPRAESAARWPRF